MAVAQATTLPVFLYAKYNTSTGAALPSRTVLPNLGWLGCRLRSALCLLPLRPPDSFLVRPYSENSFSREPFLSEKAFSLICN